MPRPFLGYPHSRRIRGFGYRNYYSSGSSYSNGKKLFNSKLASMLSLGIRVGHDQDPKNTNTDLEISSVGFENGAVIVTIMGVKSKQYLAAKSDSTQVYMTSNRRDQIKWRLEIDEESKQECFRNTETGRYLTFQSDGRVKQHHYDSKHKEFMHFIQFTPTVL